MHLNVALWQAIHHLMVNHYNLFCLTTDLMHEIELCFDKQKIKNNNKKKKEIEKFRPISKNIDVCQPAQSAQADMVDIFRKCIRPTFYKARLIYMVHGIHQKTNTRSDIIIDNAGPVHLN